MSKTRSILILLIAGLFSVCGISQTVTVSEELSLRSDDAYEVIGKMKNRFLLFHFRGQEDFVVQAFDEKMRMSWKKDIYLDKKNPKIIDVVPMKENFVVLYQYKIKGKGFLKAAKFDPAANLIDSVSFVNLGTIWYSPKFESFVSEDKKKIVISNFEKGTYFQLYSFDLEKMELLWQNVIKPDRYLDPKASESFLTTNKGDFFYVQERDNRKARMEEHRFEVYKTFGSGSEGKANTIFYLKDFLIYDLLFSYDNLNQYLVAAGLYSENSRARANGTFTLRSKFGTTDPTIDAHEFEEEFVKGISGRGVDEEKGVAEIDIQEIVFRKDGGMLLLLERNRILERRVTSGGRNYFGRDGIGYIVDYYFDDILALLVDPDGEIQWKEIFHKKQYSQDDGATFSSFFLLKTPSQIRMLFNDDIKNETTISEYVINAKGQSDRNAVFSTESQNLKLRFQEALQIASSELIVPSEKRNKLRLVRVSF